MARIVNDRVARTPATSVCATDVKTRPFLPTTRWGWAVAGVVILFTSVVGMFPLARVSGGRIGAVIVDGSSLHSLAPHGSVVLVLPITCRDDDVVSAWAPRGLDQSGDDWRDQTGTYVLKVLRNGRLQSTDGSGTTISHFEIRGRVVAFLPLYKLTGVKAPESYRESRIARRDPTPLEAVGNPDHPYNRERRAERLARQRAILDESKKLHTSVVWSETEGRVELAEPVRITCIRLSRTGCVVSLRQPAGMKLHLPEYAPHRVEWWSEEGVMARKVVFAVAPEYGAKERQVDSVEVWAASTE